MPYDVTFTTTISGTTVATVELNRGIPGPAPELAAEIEAASSLVTPIGSENIGVSEAGILKKWSLNAMKAWVLNGVSSAWNSLTGECNHIPLDTTPTSVPTTEGTLSWDAGEGAPSYAVPGGDSAVNKEIWDYYTNLSGVALVDGDIVSVIGVSGNRSAVGLTDATSKTSALACIGMVTYGGANNAKVRVTKIGTVHGLNTLGKVEGDPLWVDPANPGKLTATKPTGQNIPIKVGITQVASATVGVADVAIVVDGYVSESDTTATPTAGKIAKWGSTQNGTVDSVAQAPRTLYFWKSVATFGSPGDASAIGNWYMDAAHTIAATSLPNASDTIVLAGKWATGTLNVKRIEISSDSGLSAGFVQSDLTFDFAVINGTETEVCGFSEVNARGNIDLLSSAYSILDISTIYGNVSSAVESAIANSTIYGTVNNTAYSVARATHSATAKTAFVDADEFGFWDSVTGLWNKITGANLKATLKAYFDTLYAMARGWKSASFTAAVGGRYTIKGSATADGSVAVTDPTGTEGDVYTCVIGAGFVRIGSADFYKSRSEIVRYRNASAWETLTPYFSDAPDYAAAIKATVRSNMGAGATGDSIFTAATVAAVRTTLGEQTKTKSGDTNRASTTTYADDPDLVSDTLEANTWYDIDVYTYVTCGASGGIKMQIVIPSCLLGNGFAVGWATFAGTHSVINQSSNVVAIMAQTTARAAMPIIAHARVLTGATPGPAKVQWAQNASDGTNTTVLAKSKLVITKKQ